MYAGVYNQIIGTLGIQKAFIALTCKIPDDPCKTSKCLNDGTCTKEVNRNRCTCNENTQTKV